MAPSWCLLGEYNPIAPNLLMAEKAEEEEVVMVLVKPGLRREVEERSCVWCPRGVWLSLTSDPDSDVHSLEIFFFLDFLLFFALFDFFPFLVRFSLCLTFALRGAGTLDRTLEAAMPTAESALMVLGAKGMPPGLPQTSILAWRMALMMASFWSCGDMPPSLW